MDFDANVDSTIIPFFGGVSQDTNPHAAPDHKPEWLRLTIENARLYSRRIKVGVVSDKDHDIAAAAGADDVAIYRDIDPLFLPANLCRDSQQLEGFVCFVEADSILHTTKTSFSKILNFISEDRANRHVNPYVWSDLPEQKFVCRHTGCCGKNPASGQIQGISNFIPASSYNREKFRTGRFYKVPDDGTWASVVESFAGCFICHSDLFKRVQFEDMKPDPLEQAGGIQIFKTGSCYKTYRIDDFIRENIGGNIEHVDGCGRIPLDQKMILPF